LKNKNLNKLKNIIENNKQHKITIITIMQLVMKKKIINNNFTVPFAKNNLKVKIN
jgi:hypothetical protein